MNVRRVVAVVGAGLLLGPLAAVPATGKESGASVVREVVVSTMAPDGDVRSSRVAQLVRLDGSEVRVPKRDGLDEYRSLSGFGGPASEGTDLVWKSSGERDVVALARGDFGTMPLDVDIRYVLDGKEMSASDVRGRSGHLTIELTLTNTSGRTASVPYDAVTSDVQREAVVTEYLPLEFSVRTEFPAEMWRGVRVDGGYVQTDAHGTQLITRPGFVTPPLTDAEQTVVMEADGTDILLPKIQVFAFPRVNPATQAAFAEQLSSLDGLYGGLGGISDTIDQIYDGTLQIVDGVQDLLTGIGTLDEDTKQPVVDLDDAGNPTTLLGGIGFIGDAIGGKLLPALGELDPQTKQPVIDLDRTGTPTTLLGALGFIGNAIDDQLLPAIGEIDPQTGEPVVSLDDDGSPTTLLGALGFIENVISDDILPSLGDRDVGTGRAVKEIDANGKALTLLWGLQSTKDSYDVKLIPGMDELIAGVDAMIENVQSLDAQDPGLVEGLTQINGGLAQLMGQLDAVPDAPTGFREGLLAIQGGATLGGTLTADPVLQAIFAQLAGGAGQLLAGLGQRNPDGTPVIVVDGNGNPLTVMSALGLMQGALAQQILPGLGTRDPVTGVPNITLGPDGQPTTLLGALGLVRYTALVNPKFNQAQASLGGKVPKTYFEDCPACWDPTSPKFDPATANPTLQPGFRDAFVLFSEGLGDALKELDTNDPDAPGLVDGLEQLAGGLDDVAGGLQTFDAKDPGLVEGLGAITAGLDDLIGGLQTFDAEDPGLVEGLEQIEDGLDALAQKIQTFDDADPGVVEGLGLVRGGVQQVGSGLLALNELGLGVVRGQIGDTADNTAIEAATLDRQAASASRHTFLAQGAGTTFTTYVFELAAQTTTSRDNAVRGGLIAAGAAGLAVLGRRPRLLRAG